MRRFLTFLSLFLLALFFFCGKVLGAETDDPQVVNLPSPGDQLSVRVTQSVPPRGIYCGVVYGVDVTPSNYIEPDSRSKSVEAVEGLWTDSETFVFDVVSDRCVTGRVDFTATPWYIYVRCDGVLDPRVTGIGETTTLSDGIGSTLNVNIYKPDGSPASGATITINGTYYSSMTGSSAQFRRLNCSLSHTITASLAGYGSAGRTNCSGYNDCLCNGQERTLNLSLGAVPTPTSTPGPTPTLAPGVPTPTPTPTPVPPPWGGCGSCSSGCNGDSSKSNCWDGSSYSCQSASECVLAPNGTCWWDPGKCQNAWVEPGSDGQNCQPDDVIYFDPSNPSPGQAFTVNVISKTGYMYVYLDLTIPSNPAGFRIIDPHLVTEGPPLAWKALGYNALWAFPVVNAESGDTPYLFEFSHNSRSQYCVSKALFVPFPTLKAWMKVVGGDVHSNRR